MEASQIFASGVVAEEEVTDEEGIVEVDVTAEDVVAEEDGVALDVEEETRALELVTTEEVVGCDGLDNDALEETIG
jgi:hypothetical protein